MARNSSFSNQIRQQLILNKGTVCCNCLINCREEINFHHVIPIAIGGTNNFSNIVPLCDNCHNKIHGLMINNSISHSQLIKEGIQKAKDKGIKIGRQSTTINNIPDSFKNEYPLIKSKIKTITQVARELHLSRTTVYKYIEILNQFPLVQEEPM